MKHSDRRLLWAVALALLLVLLPGYNAIVRQPETADCHLQSNNNNSDIVELPNSVAWWTNYNLSSSPLDYKKAAKDRWSTKHCVLPPLEQSDDWIPNDVHRPGQLVIIFQYGKCGSSAMQVHLKSHLPKHGSRVVHAHGLSEELKAEIQQRMTEKQEPVWIVTMVRNRFIRDLSALFENHKYYNISRGTTLKQIMTLNQRVWYGETPRDSHHWYTDFFNKSTGVDVMQHAPDFDFSRRSLLIISGQYRILLLRYEDIADWGNVLYRYFPILPPGAFPVANPTTAWLETMYKQTLSMLPYTPEQIDQTMNGDTAQFYTPCERQAMARGAATPLPAAFTVQ